MTNTTFYGTFSEKMTIYVVDFFYCMLDLFLTVGRQAGGAQSGSPSKDQPKTGHANTKDFRRRIVFLNQVYATFESSFESSFQGHSTGSQCREM